VGEGGRWKAEQNQRLGARATDRGPICFGAPWLSTGAVRPSNLGLIAVDRVPPTNWRKDHPVCHDGDCVP